MIGSHIPSPITLPPDLIRGPYADGLPLAGEVNWGMERMAVAALRPLTGGLLQSVGVVDTGIDATHPLLAHCPAGQDYTGSSIGGRDRNGHGTHCSGTIGATDPRIGVYPGCRVVMAKGLSDSGSGAGSWIASGIRYCVRQGCGVVSMSLGSPSPDSSIIDAMREASEAGVWVVCAAGNSGPSTPDVDWPGRSEWCVSVAALDSDLRPASFSSAGAKIDTSGPGVNIWSARPGGGFASMSGTSMATPFVAGLLGLYRAALTNARRRLPLIAEVRQLLGVTSTDAGSPGVDRRTGPGWVGGVLLATLVVEPPPPPG